jgi:hypothetical protein
MIKIQPVDESQADPRIKTIYQSVRIVLGLNSVPQIFKYMAAFPDYFSYIWEQTIKNLNNSFYSGSCKEIAEFANTAIEGIYNPSSAATKFMETLGDTPEQKTLQEFAFKNIEVSSKLYLLSLSIRESIKGKFLGIKQFGEKVTENEKKIFIDFTDGFVNDTKQETKEKNSDNDKLINNKKSLAKTSESQKGLVRSYSENFFKIVDLEMKNLTKREDYLVRRVELERFSLNKLYLLPFPLDSSMNMIFAKSYNTPHFPELIYLVSELFPTEAPYKLMASSVMRKLTE